MIPRNSLAPNNRLSNVAIPTVLLVILITVFFNVVDKETSGTAIALATLALVVLIIFIVKGYYSKDIYYDDDNIYLSGSGTEITVPFTKVRRVAMTLGNATLMGLKFYRYKIVYLDSEDTVVEIHFWTTAISSSMDHFENQIKKTNPFVKIEHWAVS